MNPSITILAPAYNEEEVIGDFVETVAAGVTADEILIVDDGSTDATRSILDELQTRFANLRVERHPSNRGLGSALVTGFRAARGDVIVTMDADLSHPINLVADLAAECDRADAAYGSRFVPGGGMPGVPWIRRVISHTANTVLRRALRIPVRDMTTGFRAYRREAVVDLELVGERFETQLELTARLVHARKSIVEIPLVLTLRAAGESKMRYWSLIPRYGGMLLRMLGLRWFGPGAWRRPD